MAVDPRGFVRRMVSCRSAHLLDIVAGGNGRGRRRERGIDPTTGMEDPVFALLARRRPPIPAGRGAELIDGVFVPDGAAGPVHSIRPGTRSTAFGLPAETPGAPSGRVRPASSFGRENATGSTKSGCIRWGRPTSTCRSIAACWR